MFTLMCMYSLSFCALCLYANLDVYHLLLFMCSLCFMCMCMRMFMLSVTFMFMCMFVLNCLLMFV